MVGRLRDRCTSLVTGLHILSFAVYTLKERCLQEVRRLLPPSGAVDTLDIPQTLKRDLLQLQSVVPSMRNNRTVDNNPNVNGNKKTA